MRPQAGLVVMARWPAAGRCKRRLSQDMSGQLKLSGSAERSARLQLQLCLHTLAVARQEQQRGLISPVLAVSGLGPRAAERWGRQQGIQRVQCQGEGNLGTLLKRQLLREQLWQRPTLVIGTDLPDLNPQDLHHAVTHLQQCDLVLGPAADGGYWLIGLSRRLMRSPECWPLSGIPWGGPDVCRRTLEAAERRGHATALLQHRSDIDHLRDLRPWLG